MTLPDSGVKQKVLLQMDEEQQIRAIFGGRFVENKPIPFPDIRKKYCNTKYEKCINA